MLERLPINRRRAQSTGRRGTGTCVAGLVARAAIVGSLDHQTGVDGARCLCSGIKDGRQVRARPRSLERAPVRTGQASDKRALSRVAGAQRSSPSSQTAKRVAIVAAPCVLASCGSTSCANKLLRRQRSQVAPPVDLHHANVFLTLGLVCAIDSQETIRVALHNTPDWGCTLERDGNLSPDWRKPRIR